MGSTTVSSQAGKPEWLDALRELIFKTISPSPSANNELYKSFLEAPFYGVHSSVDSDGGGTAGQDNEPKAAAISLLARGDVYYSTTKGSWILCQDGCADCAECLLQSKPSLKWTLRRRESAFNSSSQELQLTVVPQLDDSFHMRNLRRRSHVYVTLVPPPPPRPLQSSELAKSSAAGLKRAKLGGKRSIARGRGGLVKRTLVQGSKPLTRRRKQLLRVSSSLNLQQVSSRPDELCPSFSAGELEKAPPPGNATATATVTAPPDTGDRLSLLMLFEPTKPTISSDNESLSSELADVFPVGRGTSIRGNCHDSLSLLPTALLMLGYCFVRRIDAVAL